MTPALKTQILALARQQTPALSATEIATLLRVSRNVVAGICYRNGKALNHIIRRTGNVLRDRDRKFANWNGGIQPREPEARGPRGTCRWIEGDPQGDWSYCGAPVTHVFSSWCPAHHARCYQKRVAPSAHSGRPMPKDWLV